MKHRLTIVAVAFVMVLGFGTTHAGVLVGAHVGSDHDPNGKSKLEALEAAMGRKLAIDNDHEDWMEFPDLARVRWDMANGRQTMLSWRIVFDRSNPSGGCATADSINHGDYDAQLAKQAAAIRSLGVQVFVRYNYEMSSNEENTCFTGFPVKQNMEAAGSKYVAAWRHVVDRFRAAGANNIKWVWAPGHKAFNKGKWRLFYPGADYVDWIGVDYYNKTDTVLSFSDDPGLLAFYVETAPLGKPLMVAETGSINDPRRSPDPQTLWLTTAHVFLRTHPAIKAFLWWDDPGRYSRQNPGYGGTGYVLQGPGLAAFRDIASDPLLK